MTNGAAIEVGEIEQELRALWKSASAREGEAAVIRACSCNLVVIARDEAEAAAFGPVLARVAERHPCRALIAYSRVPAACASLPPVRAWVSAQCSVHVAGGPQICSEAVTLEDNTGSTEALLSALLPLLVPDLHVVLYWRSPHIDDARLVEGLAPYAHMLIADSHAATDLPGRERLFSMLLEPPRGLAVRDLNWARLTPWRELVAGVFDIPEMRALVRRITRVELSQAGGCPGRPPARLLLLAGWLASRLGWQAREFRASTDLWESRWDSDAGEVEVRIARGGETAVRGQGPGGSFAVAQDTETGCIRASASAAGRELAQVAASEELDEADLLAGELSITGADPAFYAALACIRENPRPDFFHGPGD